MASARKKTRAEPEARNIGKLFVIGGNEDTDEHEMPILSHFVKMCGGRRARIVVCGTPSERRVSREREYKRRFRQLGAKEVVEADAGHRGAAESERLVAGVRHATGVFFTGGDQLRLTSIIAGTAFGEEIRHRLWNGGMVVGGTSAGAAAMGSTMIIGGSDRGTVRRADVRLAPGLGYWRDSVIDTHFAQRGRISRLLVVFAHNPQILGLGLDENTAVELDPGKEFTVVGAGAAYVFSGMVTHSNASEADDAEVIAMTDDAAHPAGGIRVRSADEASDASVARGHSRPREEMIRPETPQTTAGGGRSPDPDRSADAGATEGVRASSTPTATCGSS
ncbi:MAG TPA: cyanophycinase [Thermoanaerobaculia bacterium]|nr:cyanophycinase [Thermoanaerobaculia bacterium]